MCHNSQLLQFIGGYPLKGDICETQYQANRQCNNTLKIRDKCIKIFNFWLFLALHYHKVGKYQTVCSQKFKIEPENREKSTGIIFRRTCFDRAETHEYYEECDWSKKWAEGLQKILT